VLSSTGCISSAPLVPETAANAQQIQTCEQTALAHNDVVIGDFTLGGLGAASGAAAAIVGGSNTGLSTGLAVGAAVAAALATGGTGLAAFTASNFANSQCSSVVGPLPASAKP
jgi:hypothetical protein